MVNLKKNPDSIELKTSSEEDKLRNRLKDLLLNNKIPQNQILSNLGLFLDSKHLSRILLIEFFLSNVIKIIYSKPPIQRVSIAFTFNWYFLCWIIMVCICILLCGVA